MSLSQCADTPLPGDTAWRCSYVAPQVRNGVPLVTLLIPVDSFCFVLLGEGSHSALALSDPISFIDIGSVSMPKYVVFLFFFGGSGAL